MCRGRSPYLFILLRGLVGLVEAEEGSVGSGNRGVLGLRDRASCRFSAGGSARTSEVSVSVDWGRWGFVIGGGELGSEVVEERCFPFRVRGNQGMEIRDIWCIGCQHFE